MIEYVTHIAITGNKDSIIRMLNAAICNAGKGETMALLMIIWIP